MRRLVVGGDVEPAERRAVASAAVRDDAGRAARVRTRGEDVADRARAGLAAGVDHEHLPGTDRLDRALLRVELGRVGIADVLAQRHVAQRVGVAEQPQVGTRRPQTLDERVAHATPRDLHRERGSRDGAQRGLRAVRERHRPRGVDAERGGARRGRDARLRAEGRDRLSRLGDRVGERGEPGQLDPHDIARLDRARAGGRARENDVAGLERHEAREVGDEQPEGEQQVDRRVVLLDLAVDERAQADRLGVDVGRGHQRPERREPIVALGQHVRAAIVPAQVLHAGVVGGRVPADVLESALGRDAARGARDDDGDLALEREQLGAPRADDGVAVAGQRGRRLEEVRGRLRHLPALRRTTRVVDVHRDDLGGTGRRHGRIL